MTTLFQDRPVGQLVAEQPARSRVFERWGIDYCCGGRKTLADVCAKKGLDTQAVVNDLEASDAQPQPPTIDWTKEPMAKLADHIQEVHHGYLRDSLPRLTAMTERVADRHEERDPRLVELRDVYARFRSDMEFHTEKEDKFLFPAIRSLDGQGEVTAISRRIAEPIQHMLDDHDDAGAALERMRELTDGFTPAEHACNTWRAMLQALAELEADTHLHVHLENNILFPRAIEAAQAL